MCHGCRPRKGKKTKKKKFTPKKIKHLGINLSKEVKDIYTENCKTLMKEFKEDSKK